MAEGSPSRFALFWKKNGWLGLIFVGVALLVLGVSAILAAADEREQSATIETEGTVASLMTVRLSESEGRRTGYLVHVDFMVDGQETRGSQLIRWTDYEQLTEGQTIPVRYLPDDPARIWVARDMTPPLASQLRFWGFILLIFGLFLVWAPWVVAGNELKKHRDGGR